MCLLLPPTQGSLASDPQEQDKAAAQSHPQWITKLSTAPQAAGFTLS